MDEESGDRWIGSDLSKGLRFFQKAYISYSKAIQLSPKGYLDSYYNACRLLFHVYNNYVKQDGVNVYTLVNVNDAISGSEDAVVQPLGNIVAAHERAIQIAMNSAISIPLDLLFNTALVYTEQIEDLQNQIDVPFEEVLNLSSKTQEYFQELLNQQTKSFQKFLKDLEDIDNEDEISTTAIESDSETNEFESEESLQPNDVYETVISAFKLVQATLENMTSSEPYQLESATQLMQPFIISFEETAQELTARFSETNNTNSMIQSISNEQQQEMQLIKSSIEGLTTNDLERLVSIWNSDTLPISPERYMCTADNIQSFLDRNDINLETISSGQYNPEILWNALSKMTTSYKSAQDLLNLKLQEIKKTQVSGNDLGVGALIGQISDVVIARSDIDLQRSQIGNYEPAIKNQQILFQNCKTFLKSAANIANTSGGLRERAAEKLLREKRKVEAVLRLCVLENKTTIQELDNIIGRQRWVVELPYLSEMGYFKNFGIDQIIIPTEF